MSLILLVAAALIQSSPSRAASMPSPAPKPAHKNRVQGKALLLAGALKIDPAVRTHPPRGAGPTWFEVSRSGHGLMLSFISQDPAWVLNPAGSLFIQVFVDPPAQVQPSVLQAAQWPKSSDRVQLKLSGANAASPTLGVHGAAAYSFCKKGTKECKRAVSKFSL